MDKTLQVQLQIRQNAEEISTALKDIGSWEKRMKEKDRQLQQNPSKVLKSLKPRSGGTVPLRSQGGYSSTDFKLSVGSEFATPASIVDEVVSSASQSQTSNAVPKAAGIYVNRDAEEIEREKGNAEFKSGNFSAAVKSYTKCLGLKSNNYIAFSNRAMAYLKLKEYNRAITDCSCAISMQPDHVKSLLRRATAFNAVGKHRAALLDLQMAQQVEPSNKQVKIDLQLTKEMLRSAVNRAPLVSAPSYDVLLKHTQISDVVLSSPQTDLVVEGVLQGPDPSPFPYINYDDESNAADTGVDRSSENLETVDIVEIQGTAEEANAQITSTSQETFHRITVIEDSDSDKELEANEKKFSLKNGESSVVHIAKKSSKSKSAATTKKQKATEKAVQGAYDLEKRLLQYQSDEVLMRTFITSLNLSQCKHLFHSLSEPNVLYLFFQALHTVYTSPKDQIALMMLEWYKAVAKESSFSLVYSLIPSEQKEVLFANLSSLLNELQLTNFVTEQEKKKITKLYA